MGPPFLPAVHARASALYIGAAKEKVNDTVYRMGHIPAAVKRIVRDLLAEEEAQGVEDFIGTSSQAVEGFDEGAR